MVGILAPLFSSLVHASATNDSPKQRAAEQASREGSKVHALRYSKDDRRILLDDYPIILANYPTLERNF